MKNINEFINQLGLENNLHLDDIPEIDLYMDQVIQLFENRFNGSKRTEDEKILTKTMINNYAKGKLFFPIKNKKYSKEHLILISLIYQLKGALTIADIKSTLDGINHKFEKGELNLDTFYQSFLDIHAKNAGSFQEEFAVHAKEVNEEIGELDDPLLEQILLIVSLANISNMYRRAAERLIDQLPLTAPKK
ncbi:DUF1836 domain-containing protein [Pseudoneobacillus sp. C159]